MAVPKTPAAQTSAVTEPDLSVSSEASRPPTKKQPAPDPLIAVEQGYLANWCRKFGVDQAKVQAKYEAVAQYLITAWP